MSTITKVYPKVQCPACNIEFDLTRKNKRYCSTKCQEHSARGDRSEEYRKRNIQHYQLADRLTKALNTLTVDKYHLLIQTILNTAASGYAKLRNVILDPKLLKQKGSATLQVRIYCNTYLKTSTYNSILNPDRTYSKKNFVDRSITPLLQRDYPTEMTKEQVKQFEELLMDLSSWEATARAQPVYLPRPQDPLAERSPPEIEYIEILDNLPPLPQVQVIVSQHCSLNDYDVLDDDDDWEVEHQQVIYRMAA